MPITPAELEPSQIGSGRAISQPFPRCRQCPLLPASRQPLSPQWLLCLQGPIPKLSQTGGGRGSRVREGPSAEEEPSVRFPQSHQEKMAACFLHRPALFTLGSGGLSPLLSSALTPTPAQRVCWQQHR